MNTKPKSPTLLRAALALAALCLWAAPALAQTTSGGTTINNRASATYSDGTNSYSVVSNTVTVTVANVAGLTITPDGGSIPTVVAGQTNVDFTFTVTNTSNFATQVRFPASGAAIVTSGPVTVTQAVIDLTGNGLDGGDTDILGNGSPAEVRTSVPSGFTLAGSESEAVGSASTSVENDAQLQTELTVPAGPVALGPHNTYFTTVRKLGPRPPK